MKVLLTGSSYYRFNQGIAAALRRGGQEVSVLDYHDIRYEKVSSGNIYRREKARFRLKKINARIIAAVEAFRPRLFMAWGGNIILPSTLARLRERGVTLVLWLLDILEKLPQTQQGLSYYHLVYTFEPGDLAAINRLNPRASYLPPAYDPGVYRPITGSRKKYDLVFVGNRWGRLELLEELADFSLANNIKLALVGRYWRQGNISRRVKFRKRYPALRAVILKNGTLDPVEVNSIYNQSRVVLNIHRNRRGQGVNPRLFDIAGAGAFQLTDDRQTLAKMLLPGREIIPYASARDLRQKISYYLAAPEERRKIAAAAERRARKEHTYFRRMEKIISDVHQLPEPGIIPQNHVLSSRQGK